MTIYFQLHKAHCRNTWLTITEILVTVCGSLLVKFGLVTYFELLPWPEYDLKAEPSRCVTSHVSTSRYTRLRSYVAWCTCVYVAVGW